MFILGFFDSKKVKKWARIIAGVLFLVIGIFALKTWWGNLKTLLKQPISLWCIAWSSIGISAGLINTRDHNYRNWWTQHLLYCGFILVVVSLLSFTIPLFSLGPVYTEFKIKFYTLSALIGLIGGFLVDIFRDLIIVWLEKKKLLNREDN